MSYEPKTEAPEAVGLETYEQAKQRMAIEQAGKSPTEVMASIPAEYRLDLNNLQPSTHNWVKRGINPTIVACEGASHPTHRHTLRK